MIRCPDCTTDNYHGTLFCAACGAAIHPTARAHLQQVRPVVGAGWRDEAQPVRPDASQPATTGREAPDARGLRLDVDGFEQSFVLTEALIHIGRADPETGFAPEVDLEPFGGLERGVSRRHATLQRSGDNFSLIDEHSSNGTWLNGIRLLPGYAYPLAGEATIRFGDLVVYLTTLD